MQIEGFLLLLRLNGANAQKNNLPSFGGFLFEISRMEKEGREKKKK
jgi:hypothetical protein